MKSSYKYSGHTRLRERRRHGAVTVEVCIFLPLLVWITFAILQFGYIFYKEIQLTNLSRDAMRYLAVKGVDNNGISTTPYAADTTTDSVRWYVKQECQTPQGSAGALAYSDITVNVVYYPNSATSPTTIPVGTTDTTKLPAAGTRTGVQIQYNMTTSNTILLSPLVPFASNFLGEQSRTTYMMMEYPIQ